MIISHNPKYVFFHTPKCAGSAVNQALYEAGTRDEYYKIDGSVECSSGEHFKSKNINQHSKPAAVYGNIELPFQDYFTFATIRNPFTLELSRYNYAVDDYKRMRHPGFNNQYDKSWVEYCEEVYNNDFKYFIKLKVKHAITLCDRYVGENGDLLIDYVIKVEDLSKKFDLVCKILGIENHLPDKNVNESMKTKHIQDLDDEEIELINIKYKDDLEYFAYSYDDLT